MADEFEKWFDLWGATTNPMFKGWMEEAWNAALASQQQLMPCGHPQAFFQDCDYFEDSPGGRRTHILATCLLCKTKEDMQQPQGNTCNAEPRHPRWALDPLTDECLICGIATLKSHHAQALAAKEEELTQARERCEQLTVQLAGCSVAACGGTQETAMNGQYGWSQAYQDVLDLRIEHDQAQSHIAQLERELKEWQTCDLAKLAAKSQDEATDWMQQAHAAREKVAQLEAVVKTLHQQRDLVSAGVAFHCQGEPDKLCLLVNDVFAPAADGEEVPPERLSEVHAIFKAEGETGLLLWVAKRRGVEPMDWRGRPLVSQSSTPKASHTHIWTDAYPLSQQTTPVGQYCSVEGCGEWRRAPQAGDGGKE